MESALTLRDYLSILTHRWWAVALAFTVCLAAAVLWTATRTPLYAAETAILVNQGDSTDLFDPATGTGSGTRATENEARFLRSDVVATASVEQLGYDAEITVSTENSADVLRARAVSEDPERARAIAQTFSETYIRLRRASAVNDYTELVNALLDRVATLDEQVDLAQSDAERQTFESRRANLDSRINDLSITADLLTGRAEIINPADLPEAPFTPQTSRNLLLGAVLGMIAGVGIALLLESLDVSIKSTSDLEAATGGLPNLASIGAMDKKGFAEHGGLVTLSRKHETSADAEPYRTLRAALQFVAIDRDVSMLQVTSSSPSEGKSTTASNLAAVLAKNDQRVLLVDCDLRKPRLHTLFQVPQEPGVTSILIGECEPEEAMHQIFSGEGSLHLIASGPIPPGPSELLGSGAAADLFRTLRTHADYVIIDSPPVLPVADALVISRHTDATILVANASKSTQHDVKRALEMLDRVEAPILGTVLNQVGRRGLGGNGYGYGYGYGYGHAQAAGQGSAVNTFRGRLRRVGRPEEPEIAPIYTAAGFGDDDAYGGIRPRTAATPPPESHQRPTGETADARQDTHAPYYDVDEEQAAHRAPPSGGTIDERQAASNGAAVTRTSTGRQAPPDRNGETRRPRTSVRRDLPPDLPAAPGDNRAKASPFGQLVDGDGWMDDDITAL